MTEQKNFYQLEKNILKYKEKIDKLRENEEIIDKKEIERLKNKISEEWNRIQPNLTPLQYVQIARHPQRPYTLDYLNHLTDDFLEFHGDRRAGDDPALVAGFGFYRGRSVAFIGHQKGRTTSQRIARKLGQPKPEG